jgi:hypothetical protein
MATCRKNLPAKTIWKKTSAYRLRGGAIVSGYFQAFDQSYLIYAIKELGISFGEYSASNDCH